MALKGVIASSELAFEKAETIARSLNIPYLITPPGGDGVVVVVTESAVGLGFADKKAGKPFFVDFSSRYWRTRWQQGLPKSHIFRRALGPDSSSLKVFDATAGFAQDAVMALTLGCEVTAVERNPVVVYVLRDALERLSSEDEVARAKLKQFQIVEGDATQILETKSGLDVIYMDPMFDKPKKSAKSPKEMQLLQDLLQVNTTANDEEALFARAMAHSAPRVVVKRPLKSQALGRTPNHSFKGQSIRYDVYLKN